MSEIDRLEVVISANATNANAQLNKLCSSLSRVSAQLQRTNQFSTSIRGMNNLSTSVKGYSTSAKSARISSFSLASAIGKIYANVWLLIRAFKSLGKAISSSMDYVETYNYLNVTLDKIAKENSSNWERYGYDSAESYAESFKGRLNELTEKMTGYTVGENGALDFSTAFSNLGQDVNEVMNFEASISAVTNAVGLMGESSIAASKILSMLSVDLSSLKNVDLSTVMTNLQSGLIGQSRAMYKYGIDITNNTLQTYAYKEGLSKAVSEMTQAEKMQLRLIAILDQSKVAWGDQANTINSVANQWRIFKQQIKNLGRIIGNLFIPLLQAVLPYINAIIMVLQKAFMGLGKLLGVDSSSLTEGISTGYSSDSLDDFYESLENTVDEAEKADAATKKLKKTLLGFDEINAMNDNSNTGSSGSGSGGSGSSFDLSDSINAALAEYESVWNKALKDSENKATKIANNIISTFSRIGEQLKIGYDIGYVFDSDEELAKYKKQVANGIKDVWESSEVQRAWVEMSKSGFQSIGALFGAGKSVANSFYTGYMGGLAKLFANDDWKEYFSDKLESIFGNVEKWNDDTTDLAEAVGKIGKAFEGEGFQRIYAMTTGKAIDKMLSFVDKVTGFFTDLKELFTSPFIDNAELIADVLDELGGAVADVMEALGLNKRTETKDYEDTGLHKFMDEVERIQSVGFGEGMQNILDGIKNWRKGFKDFRGDCDGINDKFEELKDGFSKVGECFKTGWESITSWFSEKLGPVKEAFTATTDHISASFQNTFDNLSSLGDGISLIFGELKDSIELQWSDFKDWFSENVTEPLKLSFEGTKDRIVDVLTYSNNRGKEVWSTFSDWFNTKVWTPISDGASATKDILSRSFTESWNNIKGIWSNVSGWFSSNVVEPVKSLSFSFLNGILGFAETCYNGLMSGLEAVVNFFIRGINSILDPFNDLSAKAAKLQGKSWTNVTILDEVRFSRVSLPRFATGQYDIDAGQAFIAREKGPELVGTIKGKTSVANNNQIVESVSKGVYDAVVAAMVGVGSGQSSDTEHVQINVYLDSEVIAEANEKGQRSRNRRYDVKAFA